ncbi:MAG: SpoIIE family protein phosphatase [Bacteroidetes bacterium]|nr:SpoIIE family protein phosphatase [Bacteroidota bacterium]
MIRFFPKKFFRLLITAFIYMQCGIFLGAQDYKFSHLTLENGLSQSVVNCILQDSRGFMWFGTQEGLNRYDGYNFLVYKRDPDNKNSLSNNFIYSICESSNGVIWIGTNGGGLDAFDPYTEKFTHYVNDPKNQNSLSNDIVHVIHETKDGKIWAGTENGLNAFDPSTKKFTRYFSNFSGEGTISSDKIYDLAEDEKGNLWIGTYGKNISMFDASSNRFYNYDLSDDALGKLYSGHILLDDKRKQQCRQVRSMLMYDKKHMWIGTNGGGVQIFNTETHSYEKALIPDGTPFTISTLRVLSMAGDGNGNIWLGAYDSGVDVFNKSDGTFQHYTPNENDFFAVKSSTIKCVFEDRDGNMWLGTSGEGLNVYFRSTSQIGHIRKSERPGVGNNTLMSNKIQCVMEDFSGLLWIGTSEGGLTTLDRATNTYTQHPELSTATNNSILSLLQASDSTIWVGTYGEGLNHYFPRTNKIVSYSPKNRLQEGSILCIAEEPGTGAIWFGTFGAGIYRLDPKTDSLQEFTAEHDSLSVDYIFGLYFDKRGDLWVGTRAGGVMVRPRGTNKFISYQHDDNDRSSISNNIVYNIAEDNSGHLWMSTANGIDEFDPATKKFRTWYERDGLPSDNIYAVVIDPNGNLWLSHNKGITRFSPSKTGDEMFRNFGPAAGVQTAEFNQGAYFQNKKGEIFFGGQGGLNIIDIRTADSKSPPPPVFIISYKRFGKEIRLDTVITDTKLISVGWRDNNFQFELSALDYVDPTKNLYRYRLEGADEEWSPATTNRYVSYTNLPGGDYALYVRAADSNGNWSNEKLLVRIHVEPPFWKTNWFYTLCVLVIITGFFGFVRYRTAAIKKENRILETKVAERTQELAQKNADITASIQYARRIQSAMLPDLNLIYSHFPESFVVYKPKDIVSGDFYWFGERKGKCVMAVADCTGHGVPGALMSMIGHDLLNQIVLEKGIDDPGTILDRLNEGVRAALKQDQHDQDTADGMDIAVCVIDRSKHEVNFAGALRPLIVIRNGLLSKIDSDRFPIGGTHDTRDKKFTTHRFKFDKGDTIYMFSDGFADQFGGERGKKFMMKRLLEKLVEVHVLPMTEQASLIENTFDKWKEGFQQVDDVLIAGIRI